MNKFLLFIISIILVGSTLLLYKNYRNRQQSEQLLHNIAEMNQREQDLELKFSELRPGINIESFSKTLGTPDVIDHPVFDNAKEYRYVVDDKYVVLPEVTKDDTVIGFEALARDGFYPHFKLGIHVDITLNKTSFQDAVNGNIEPEKCYLIEKNNEALLYFEQFNSEQESFSIGLQTFKYFENNLPNYRVSIGDLPFDGIPCKKVNPDYKKLIPNTFVSWNNDLLKASMK